MSTVTFESLLPPIAAEVPGCPDPTLMRCLIEATRELCQASHRWVETLDPLPVYAGQATVELEAPCQAHILRVLSLRFEGRRLVPLTEAQLDAARPRWREASGPTAEAYVHEDAADTLLLIPTPDTTIARALTDLRVVLQPTFTSTRLSAALVAQYLSGLVDGTIARALAMHHQPWSDPAGAAFAQQRFRQVINTAKRDRLTGNSYARVELPPQRLRGCP